jgi:hypothetical protein
MSLFIGPYLKAHFPAKSLKIDRCPKFRLRGNKENYCEYPDQTEGYCNKCGYFLTDRFYDRWTDSFELSEDVDLAIEDRLVECGFHEEVRDKSPANIRYFLSNQKVCERKFWFDDKLGQVKDLLEISKNHDVEIREFEKFYAKEIEAIKSIAEKVEICWGLVIKVWS